MNALFAAAAEIETFSRSRGWRCTIIGGLAVQRWGEPRQTRDVDVTLLTGLGGEERFRSTAFVPAPGVSLTTCSAEDLVVLKAFAGRIQDWLDIEGIVVRQRSRLDRNLVLHELGPLLDLKDDRESQSRLEALFTKHPAVQ